MDAYRQELSDVNVQLADTEQLLEDLLNRQNNLLQKKEELEKILLESSAKPKVDDKDWSLTDFSWSSKLKEKMKSVFHVDKLRLLQMETMNVTMAGKDCLLIMPTGGGKSLCFQLPAVISDGITLVVGPLISLIEDQLVALEALQVDACTLNSSVERHEATKIMNAMIDKNSTLKILYVTPEKLAKSKMFMAKLGKMYQMGRFSRLVIDEVHCCSQWGHDFRPDYKFLGIMKRQFPDVPILGLTATATVKVLNDVKKILNLPNCNLFRASFNRPNLFYEVREKPSIAKEVLEEISMYILKKFRGQSGIVYCFSRKESEDVTVGLRELGVQAGCYHAYLESHQRTKIHRAWLSRKIQVIVATVAFGMGIDKPDVRFVIHHSLSKSMENLYQESGRAGRDDKTAHCIVYYRLRDVMRQSTMVFTEQTGIENLYGLMDYCSNVSRCRRSMIARHFGEKWTSTDCNMMCDNCKSHDVIKKRDVSKHTVDVLHLVERGKQIEQKLTLIKLMDAWFGKGAPGLRIKEIKVPSLSRETCERIIVMMLMKGYLKEEFHFTPYSTIEYLVRGPQASLLKNGREVLLDFRMKGTSVPKNKPGTFTNNSTHSSSNSGTKDSGESSLFSPDVPIIVEINHQELSSQRNSQPVVVKKRKAPIIIDDDSNSDDSDVQPIKITKTNHHFI